MSTPAAPKPSLFWRLLPLLMGSFPALLFCLICGWFLHELVDLSHAPWQSIIMLLIAVVIFMVVATLVARAVFWQLVPSVIEKVSTSFQTLAQEVRAAPKVLTTAEFWLDRVWPVLKEGKKLILGWVSVYSTMAAVVALAAILCQTGTLAVAYLQIDRLDKQNAKIDEQILLSKEQNTLLTSQNKLLEDQNLLSESARRAALLQIVGDVLTSIDAESKGGTIEEVSGRQFTQSVVPGAKVHVTKSADERPYTQASPRLIGRLAAASSSLRGYRYLGDDGKPIARPRSPERGFILRSVVAAGIDVTGIIDQKADFSYAEAENAVIENYRLEPTPLAASTAPGMRGLQLTDSQLEGISFRGSRLGDASFKRAHLQNANFAGARLVNTSFEYAEAGGAIFIGADLRGADFFGADLQTADFSAQGVLGDTILPPATVFEESNLDLVDFAGAFVSNEKWIEDLMLCTDTRLGGNGEPFFDSTEWKVVLADRRPVVRHDQDQVLTDNLEDYKWRIVNADGSLTPGKRRRDKQLSEFIGEDGRILTIPHPRLLKK